jgi:hypothetical protein
MKPTAETPRARRSILCLVALGVLHALAPWPGPQCAVMAFLVLGLAPGFASMLPAVLWAGTAGWILEGSLRLHPHLGGTALGNMLACMAASWLLHQWPPHSRKYFLGRLAGLVLVQTLLVHLCVRLAGGPHPWGLGWVWALVLVPLWGDLALRLVEPAHRR